jgi:hypothetical protein
MSEQAVRVPSDEDRSEAMITSNDYSAYSTSHDAITTATEYSN